MDTKKLRQKIHDLAIRGKLVPQDPNDEPASVLLERIRAEKERLVKEGKIKKSKASKTSDTPHYENVPFEVPSSWVWTTINNIAFVTKLAGFEYTKYIAENISTSEGVPLFKGKNILNGEIVYKFEAYIPLDISNELFRSQITKRCLLTPYVGTIGNIGIHDKEGVYHLGSNVGKIELFNNDNLNIYEEFVKNYLLSSFGYKELTKQKKATAQESISIEAIREVLLPLPPLAEQKRIVAEIERWFVLVDHIEQGKVDLQSTIKPANSKILDLAIHGKLVPQDPSDEPASELLKRINPKTKITCDNGHYENLPNGWCLAPMQMFCSLVDGEKQKNIERINLDVKYLRGEREAKTLTEGKFVAANTLLILVDGENSGEVFRTHIEGYQGSTFKQLYIDKNMSTDYILQVINMHRQTLRENKVGSAIPHLNKKLFKAIEVPIPPYKEQLRIVDAINIAFKQINTIMESL